MTKVAIIGNGVFGGKIKNCIQDSVQFVEPDDADWVIIATPNDLHYEQVEKWLIKRKNIFCEKPLTLTEKSSKELFLLADFFDVKLYVDDVFSWHDNLSIDPDGHGMDFVDFKFHKYGSFNANVIDNLAYHHFYLWADSSDIEIDKINNIKNSKNNTSIKFQVKLQDGRCANFDYNILSDEYEHTIYDGWDTVNVNPNNNPLRDMLLKCFDGSVDFDKNRKKTLNAVKLCEAVKKEVYSNILVVGGGIFGVTSAVMLASAGYNVTLHEELSGIMRCASDINQYRLHRGYHYPRSKSTVEECLDGLKSFKRKYGDSIVNGNVNHYYAISSRDSLVTKEQYLEFLDEMELDYDLQKPLMGTDLTVKVKEDLFNKDKLWTQATQKIKWCWC